MGLYPIVDAGPNNYQDDPNLADWSWQVATSPVDISSTLQGPPLTRVEIVIRNNSTGYSFALAHFLPSGASGSSGGTTTGGLSTSGGGG